MIDDCPTEIIKMSSLPKSVPDFSISAAFLLDKNNQIIQIFTNTQANTRSF